jgi:ketosteroid isomerase-like protein
MSTDVHSRIMHRMTEVLRDQDWAGLGDCFAPDATLEFPQSRERFRGLENIQAQFAGYPALEPGSSVLEEVIGTPQAYALTPSYTVIAVDGSGSTGTAIIRVRYPDGSLWYAINVYELRDGLIARSRTFFAPDFDAPDWRAAYRDSP